jgi:hypothetical protein
VFLALGVCGGHPGGRRRGETDTISEIKSPITSPDEHAIVLGRQKNVVG